MGCVTSKVSGSGPEPLPSKRKTTRSSSEKENKTKKSSEKSTSKDAAASKKSTAESKKSKPVSVKPEVDAEKGVCPYGFDKNGNEGEKEAKPSSIASKIKNSSSGIRKSIEKTFSKDKKSTSTKDKESSSKDKSDRKDSKSKKDEKVKTDKSTAKHSSNDEKNHEHSNSQDDNDVTSNTKSAAEKKQNDSTKVSRSSIRANSSQNKDKERTPKKTALVSFDSTGAKGKKTKPVPMGGSSPSSRLDKPKINSFDEKPISQSKNLSTKSWWEMDDEPSISMDSYDPKGEAKLAAAKDEAMANDRFGSDRRGSGHNDDRFNDEQADRPSGGYNGSRRNSSNRTDSDVNDRRGSNSSTRNSANNTRNSPNSGRMNNNSRINNNGGQVNDNEIINDFLDKPSYGKTYSSENVNDAPPVSNRGPNRARAAAGASRPNRQQQEAFPGSDEFKSFADDFMNSTGGRINNSVKIELPFDEIEAEQAAPRRFPGGPAPAWADENENAPSPPVGRANFRSDSPPLRGAPGAQFSDPEESGAASPPLRKSPRPPARFAGLSVDEDDERQSSAPQRFSRPLPSGPTDVPGSSPSDEEAAPLRPKYTPCPKFQRPLPLKRGAGMINRKAAPIVKAPEDVINALIDRIPNIDNSKFNEHIKVQKELVEQMEKAPEAFAKTDLQLVIRTARKIIEVAGGNRSNVARSSLICLGHMFRILGGALNPLVVDAVTLCAKKGVSSSPEHLVVASNFCMSNICQTSLEPKVGSMLVSLYRNNKAYQLLCLSGMVVLLDRMGEGVTRLKNLDEIVDCAVKGITSGGIPSRAASRNVLGMIDAHSNLENHLNMCKCTEITKVTVRQLLTKYDDDSKAAYVEDFSKSIVL